MIERTSPSYHHLLETVLEKAHEAIVVTDADGYIMLMNKAYRDFLGVEEVIGRKVEEVIENTRMQIVAKTGKSEIADIHRIKGKDMIANRIPIFDNGKVYAVIGTVTFQDVRELYALSATVDQLNQELDFYKKELRRRLGAIYNFDQIIGTSPIIQEVKKLAQKVAKSDATVLITGESGTGKELFAHAVHAASRREMGPFIRVNCAAIPDTLLESELFGYESGAFTGASQKGKKGKFELADHGTILLDEIGDMPLQLQAKLLRVLQEKELERVGGLRPIPIDVRVIASTNCNLPERIKEGKFREDLFYRLNVVTLKIPALRERLEDLPFLVGNILEQLMASTGIVVKEVEGSVWDVLKAYSWPGNVRELRNILERALHTLDDDCLRGKHIMIPRSGESRSMPVVQTLKESLEQAEKEAIIRALAYTDNNKLEAAKQLGISKSGLYQKLMKYDLLQ